MIDACGRLEIKLRYVLGKGHVSKCQNFSMILEGYQNTRKYQRNWALLWQKIAIQYFEK